MKFGRYSTVWLISFRQLPINLGPKTDVVTSPDFEIGVIKAIIGREKYLTQAEHRELRRLRRTEESCDIVATNNLSSADRLLQGKRKQTSRFIDLRWIPPTSNDVELLFSTAGLILTDRRQHRDPTTLKTLVLLLGCGISSGQPSVTQKSY
ncbi:unnamed protein product [Phytophthora lilii]|uniref:Unnamed protein product n=1 Tax=Phytophthora lilii TaxID=2077276 RepID=A0A9W6WQT4_9STRA|nr:unnamed protein product [Phytophthora lilii]